MAKIKQEEIKGIKKTYKRKYHQELSDENARIIEYGATRLAEILCQQIITDAQPKKRLENK